MSELSCVFDRSPGDNGREVLTCVACGRVTSLPARWAGRPVEAACGVAPAAVPAGVGTHLKLLLAALGVTPGGCACEQHAREMDVRGVAWCEANRATIIGWLRSEWEKDDRLWTEEVAAATALILEQAIAAASQATPPA